MPVKKGNNQVMTVVTDEEKAKLLALAKSESRSLSNMIAHIIRQYLTPEKK